MLTAGYAREVSSRREDRRNRTHVDHSLTRCSEENSTSQSTHLCFEPRHADVNIVSTFVARECKSVNYYFRREFLLRRRRRRRFFLHDATDPSVTRAAAAGSARRRCTKTPRKYDGIQQRGKIPTKTCSAAPPAGLCVQLRFPALVARSDRLRVQYPDV